MAFAKLEMGNMSRGEGSQIPGIIFEERRVNPIKAMGWSNRNLIKVWKLVFPLTKMSAELGFLPLTDPTWGLIPNPLMIGLHSIA